MNGDDKQTEGERKGLISNLMQGMHPVAKFIVSILITVPVTLALTGMLLNINVGALLDKYFQQQLDKQTAIQESVATRILEEYNSQMMTINVRLSAIEDQLAAIPNLEQSTARLADRLADMEPRLDQLEQWACEHANVQDLDSDYPRFCK